MYIHFTLDNMITLLGLAYAIGLMTIPLIFFIKILIDSKKK